MTQESLSEREVKVPNISIQRSIPYEFSLKALPIRRHGVVLQPNGHPWESKAVFNAAATKKDGKVFLFYRAFGPDNPMYEGIPERPSSVGLAISSDGKTIEERLENPVIENAEDPRITRLNGKYSMTYTKINPDAPPEKWDPHPHIAITTDLRNFQELGLIEIDGLEDVTKNVALLPGKVNGRYAALARQKPDIFIIYSNDLIHWGDAELCMQPRKGSWDSAFIGPGATPFKTLLGFLHIYHGVDESDTYKLGVALHDLKNPSKVLARSKESLLQPEEDYEKNGVNGNPPHHNIIYSCGAVPINGSYYIYYGAADQALALASVPRKKLQELMKN